MERRAKFIERIPLRRAGTAQDIADLVAFVASRSVGFVTGKTWSVNGGAAMR